MLTGLKVSSLPCKQVFYKPKHNVKREDCMELNFKGLEIQKWNIPTERAQRLDEKNVALCLVVMFTPRVMVVKMSKLAYFLFFLLMAANNYSQFGQIFKCAQKILLSCTSNKSIF